MSASHETRAPAPIKPERDGSGGAPQASPRRRRTIRPGALGWIVALVVVVVVAVWLFLRDDGDGSSTATDVAVATTTAQVERRDLVETESVDGTLGYAGSRNVIYAGPGVAARRSGGTGTATAYDQADPEALAISYRQTTPTETTADVETTGDGTDPATTTGETTTEPTTTDSAPAEPTPSETAPPDTSPTETAPAETTPSEPSTPETQTADGIGSASGTSGAQTESVPSSSADRGSATTADGASARQSGASENASSGSGSATVTWLPDEGAVLERGDELFRANGKATLLLYGETPAWRTLRKGMKGQDVRQLEQNLVALGYGRKTITVDNRFGAATKRAVQAWQRGLGVDDTGVVKLGMVAFLPGDRRVQAVDVALGDQIQVGQTVLTTVSTRQWVTVDLDASDQELLAVGDDVTIELPDGSEIAGTVDDVGTVATASESSAQDGQAEQGTDTSTATVPVVITIEGAAVELDEAPVDVEIASDTAEAVLTVPVTALVGLLGGGYAVEVVDENGQTSLLRADPGMYADGYVEIEGDGITEGTTVVVPE